MPFDHVRAVEVRICVNDYAQIFTAFLKLGMPDVKLETTRQEMFRRMVFNYAAANCDDHAKNHSFLMDETSAWSLAPAYDVTHAYNPEGDLTRQHLKAVNQVFMTPYP